MVTNQSLVLKSLYWSGKEQTVKEISKDTGLNSSQIHTAIVSLKSMNYIKVRREPPYWKDGKLHSHLIFAKLVNPQLTEQTLKKRGAL